NGAIKNANQAGDDRPPVQYLNVKGFETALKDRNQIFTADGKLLNLENVRQLLPIAQKAPYRSLLGEYTLKPDTWERAEFDDLKNDFLLSKVKYKTQQLLEADPIRTQRRYRVQLWLEGVNTDIESSADGEPKVSPSKDRFVFL